MVVTLVGGLLCIAWLRHLLARQWPKLSETRLDVIAVILLVVLVGATEWDHHNSEKGFAATKKDLADTQQTLGGANKQIDGLKKQVRDVDQWGPTDEQWKVVTANLQTEALAHPPPPDEQEPFISCIMGDAQSTRFAAKLANAFKDAGWKIKGVGYRQGTFEPVPEGVKFHIHSRTENIPALGMVLTTLDFFGIKRVGYVQVQMPPGKFAHRHWAETYTALKSPRL